MSDTKKVKVHKVVCLVMDLNDDNTDEEVKILMENNKYPEFCCVMSIETQEIDYNDDHPLNSKNTHNHSFCDIFGDKNK